MVKELVYFVTYDDAKWRVARPVIKIGYTCDLVSRLQMLSTSSPINLIAAGTIWSKQARSLESRLHQQFRKNRLNGEWFSLNANIINELRKYNIVDDRFDELFNFSSTAEEIEIGLLKAQISDLTARHSEDYSRILDLENRLALYEPIKEIPLSETAKQVRYAKMIRSTKKFARSMVACHIKP